MKGLNSNFVLFLRKIIMYQYQSILVQHEDNIVTLTINRPESLNALNKSVFDDLEQFFMHDINNLHEVRGVILTGSGEKAFAAGADIKEFSNYGQDALAALSASGQMVFNAIENCRVPVVAAVNGFALGGGCELAMACHLRIAADNARFGQPEVNLGLTPGYAGTQRLPMLVGKTRATEMLLTARIIDANEAEKIGLINKVVPKGESLSATIEFMGIIKTKAPLAISKTLQCIQAFYESEVNGQEFESLKFGECALTNDFKEGTTAFMEKRPANFTNS